MTVRCVAVLFLAVFAAQAADPRLRFEPAQPHPGETVTVTFDPVGGPLEKSESLTLVYGFIPIQSSRVTLKPKGNRFTAGIVIPADVAYLWCWVVGKDATEKDTNRGGVWDTYLYDDHGFPVKNARALRASIYRMSDQPAIKTTAALNLLEEEVRAFPDNGRARAEWWALRFDDEGRTLESLARLQHEIAVFWDSHLNQPWAYQAAVEGYNRLGRTGPLLEVMRAFVKRFPEDPLLDGALGLYFMQYGTTADLEGLPRASSRWTSDRWYWEQLFQAYEWSHAAPEKLLHAGQQWLALVPKDGDWAGGIRIRVAEGWLANGVDPAAAEKAAREAVSVAETGGKAAANTWPDPRLTPRTMLTPVNRSTLGWALFQEGRYEEALHELERAAAIGEQEKIAMREVYYRLGQTLERLNRSNEAMDAYGKEVAWGFGGIDGPARAAAALIYAKSHGGPDGFDPEFRSRVNDLIAQAHTEEPVEDANESPGRFDLRGPDGRPVPLNRFAGKVVIIDYWSTWCGPCLISLENTQNLARQFPGKVAVLAVSIDSEETRARAQPYLKEKGYDFVLLFDDEFKRDLRVPYVPSRFLLDRAGRLRVREFGVGLAPDTVFEQKLRAVLAESPQ